MIAAFAIGVGNTDQFYARQFRQYPGVVRAHHADADNANPQGAVAAHFLSLTHTRKAPLLPRSRPYWFSVA